MRHQALEAALLLALLLAVGACADDSRAIPRPSSPLSAGASGVAPARTPPPSRPGAAGAPGATDSGWRIVDGNECTDLTRRAIEGHIDDAAVTRVALEDDCRTVRIGTTLADTRTAEAVAICAKAAEVAWGLGARQLTVESSGARPLASATPERGCTSAG